MYNNLGNICGHLSLYDEQEDCYLKAIEIRENLAKTNPERFNPDLAKSYNNAGAFYDDQGEPKKAGGYYLKAIGIREDLVKTNPERFNPDLAVTYFNYGIFSKDVEYFKKALSIAKTQPNNPYCKAIIDKLKS